MLTLGSMCTGTAALDSAVSDVLAVEHVWFADPDPGASALLAHHWPHVPNLGDITTADWAEAEPVDVLTAGYPCQPFSAAGTRKGTSDERHIWPYIADAVRVLRPRLLVLENVANHLRLGFADVLADLAGLGFDAEWCLARASEVGAPHRRARLFVIAWPASDTQDDRLARARRSRERRSGPKNGHPASADTAGDRCGYGGAPSLRRVPASAVPGGPSTIDWGLYRPAINRWADAIGRATPHPVEPATNGGRRLSTRFTEWMMGLPAGHVTAVPGLSHGQRCSLIGNGVVRQQGAAALELLLDRAGVSSGAVVKAGA